ncbi:Alpha/Beta hydrolase protein [Thelonectria olida]|uniref:Alpha/Beta hydrolase protein n=1 Tax=Thelonectria olida TaxID=1576542 RepID=A0A9P8W9T6_9HYPO|nr:Alpha/Beta hydrolase protein [Thelonectria olida]
MDASPELFVALPTRVKICYQTIGNPADPAVVLIPGGSGSMLEWRDGMLALFSPPENPHFLIRFDSRDTGLSTEFPVPGGYTLGDMAGDIEGLVDHIGLTNGFHIVGPSMGGPIAAIVAARRSQQVRSLTLLYASPGATSGLPLKEGYSSLGVGSMGYDKQTFIQNHINLYKSLTTQPPDEGERKDYEALVRRICDRESKSGTLYSKGPNHGGAAFAGWPGLELLKDVQCPATVIQAAKDQIFGKEHGETLAKGIEKAEYVLWDDVGHELPWRIWKRMAEVFLQTWKRGDDAWVKGSDTAE